MATQTQPSVNLKDDRGGYILASVSTVLVLAIVSTVLRLAARRIQKIEYRASDYMIIVALVFALGFCALILTSQSLSEAYSGDAYID